MKPILLLSLLTLTADPLKPGDHTRSLNVDKRTRSYIVHVPPGYDGKNPIPVAPEKPRNRRGSVRRSGTTSQHNQEPSPCRK